MAYKLIWSPASRDDLHDIVVFISRDNPQRAMAFGYRLISETDKLQAFPEIDRMVPEYHQNVIIFFFGDNDVTLSCRGGDRRSDPRWQFRKGGAAPENLCE